MEGQTIKSLLEKCNHNTLRIYMAEIDSVKLVGKHEREWKFSDRNGTIRGGFIDVKDTVDGSEWRFQCRSDGNKHCLYGNEWRRFVGARINVGRTRLTLYKEDDEAFHKVR